MGFLTDWLTDWLKELLIEGIMGNLTGLFDTVNSRVGEIAVQVGTTPAAWNAGVFSLIRQLSETVILPIAGLILTFVATYELIQLIIEKNNLHDLDYWIFFKWIFKTACAILILSNTFNIVMAVFDVSQSVIARAAGIVQGSTDISEAMLADLEATLEALGLGSLLGLWLQSLLIHVTMWAINIVIFVIVYGRMIEIYLLTSLAPIPVATLSNRELGNTGQNYLKSLFAVGFQGLLILVCVAIYAVLIQGIATGGDPIGAHVLARFVDELHAEDFDLLFVVNANRPETHDLEKALASLRGVEAACGQKMTGLVNNTHLCAQTTAGEILKGAALAHALSQATGLPVVHHAVQRCFVPEVCEQLAEPILPLDIYMKKPWEITMEEDI